MPEARAPQQVNKIPTIDLKDMDHDCLVQTTGDAIRNIGFLFVKHHSITTMLPAIYPEFRKFFNLPEKIKMKTERKDTGHQIGYTPSFTEVGLACRRVGSRPEQPDAKECYFMRTELPSSHSMKTRFPLSYPDNIWPKEVPNLKPAMTELFKALYDCGTSVLELINEYLGNQPGYLPGIVQNSPTSMRAIHYPPLTADQVGKVQWACKHTDINLLTVLPASTRSGLWIRCLDGTWISGTPTENAVIVQAGDMLQWHTRGFLRSAVHEVRPPMEETKEGRLSAALFMHPRSDFILNPNSNGKRFPSKIAGDFLSERLNAIGLANQSKY